MIDYIEVFIKNADVILYIDDLFFEKTHTATIQEGRWNIGKIALESILSILAHEDGKIIWGIYNIV